MRAGRPSVLGSIVVSAALMAMAPVHAEADELPEAIRAPGETVVLKVHAEGAQIYECAADAAGALVWRFREPIATLLRDGKTVGQHFAGPRWRLADGGGVRGEVIAKAPGAAPADVPWLKLAVAAHEGGGALDQVTTIQRINTVGGVAAGACGAAGTFLTVAYSADYVFLRK